MRGRIITSRHETWELPELLSWELLRTGSVPCDSFEALCPYTAEMAEAAHLAVSFLLLEGERLLLDLEFRRLDGMIGLHNFDDHALYGYAMKLQLLERQRTFRYESGKRAFDGLMQNIRQQVSSL